jgi:spore maturation protein CgeB
MKIAIVGLSITSSWGNGHATTYRALVRGLAGRGHDVVFLERDAPWYAENRDLPNPPYCRTRVYSAVAELETRHLAELQSADLVIVGSYVPDGIAIGDLVHRRARGITAFYDIDTPVTLARLKGAGTEYLAPRQIPRYDLYLSFTGGPTLEHLEGTYGARLARPLYCSVDPDLYYPEGSVSSLGVPGTGSSAVQVSRRYDLGYLGTYSEDRQPILDRLMLRGAREWAAGRFIVAGPQYPDTFHWPVNVERVVHLAPAKHRQFYNRLRYTLNVTRDDMVKAGYSPSVRLFEAAACGTPIISDVWPGIEHFFLPSSEILLARSPAETLSYLRDIPEPERIEIGRRARARVLRAHTAAHRAVELEGYVREVRQSPPAHRAAAVETLLS